MSQSIDEQKQRRKAEAMDLINSLSRDDLPLVFPDELIAYDLKRAGFQSKDKRLIRLVSLATQKFLGDICDSCSYEYKVQSGRSKKERRLLTMEMLSSALKEYGIDVKKPPYYSDKTGKPGGMK